jgi:hypothetical protein
MSCVKSFLLHYIPNEIALHKLVYPNWEVCVAYAHVY